jgi:hypothetical protein
LPGALRLAAQLIDGRPGVGRFHADRGDAQPGRGRAQTGAGGDVLDQCVGDPVTTGGRRHNNEITSGSRGGRARGTGGNGTPLTMPDRSPRSAATTLRDPGIDIRHAKLFDDNAAVGLA